VLAFQLKSTVYVVGGVVATPVPDKDSLTVESEALLANETVAEAAPLLCGLNVTE
jgi:hypothetical protein